MNFLFIFYFLGLIFAVYQDITRREIDDWLNLFLFSSGVLFLIFVQDLAFNPLILVAFGFFIFSVSLLCFGFYYGRFFSGGDSKLFFALSPIFFTSLISSSFYNLFLYIALLFCCGSIYSLIYSFFLFSRDFKKVSVVFLKEIKKKYNLSLIGIFVILFVVGLFEKMILLFSFLILFFVVLICMAKSLEQVSMKREVSTKYIREGDWLFYDVKVGKKLFRKSWEGLSSIDVKYMKKFKKNIFIKDGIPYAPSFLFAILIFYFKDFLMNYMF